MRNLIYAINLSLDGCCDHTKFNPPDDDEVLEHYTQLLRDFDLLVYGRKTYQLMVPYWPDIAKSQSETKANIEFAQTFVSKKKIVFSRSLASAEDENTRIVRTNLRDEIFCPCSCFSLSISSRRFVRTILVFSSSALANDREKTIFFLETKV